MSCTILPALFAAASLSSLPSRPAPEARTFRSAAVDAKIAEVAPAIGDARLRAMFEACYPNTLDTTVKGEGYLVTGDIDAMWLRDASAQLWPYLRFLADDPALAALVRALLRREFDFIRRDPYANAFYCDPGRVGEWKDDLTDMKPGVHERKWEVDSLCYPLRLAHGYWKATGDADFFKTGGFEPTVRTILATFREQQRKAGPKTGYRFRRVAPNPTDSLSNYGYGPPVRPVGLIASAFRPSDDATTLPFHVPDNFFAADVMRKAAEILRATGGDAALAADCDALAGEVSAALAAHAVVKTDRWGPVYAYEIDGFGGAVLMDDANVPSLLSLPYLCEAFGRDEVYLNTRRMVLSPEGNPYCFRGRALEGIGSPHTGYGKVWPMAITMRILTSDDEAEIGAAVEALKVSAGGTLFMHEGVDADDPGDFTRGWFAWANGLFGEAILRLAERGLLR